MIRKFISFFLISYVLANPSIFTGRDVTPGDLDWWKHAVIYQIYPRSFKDSDGDGIGDLQGIISKLDHLKDAGVTAAWLSPIYSSPQIDAGYDISDYINIDKDYGTLHDFDELIKKASELGIKIVMDFVPNHSSDKHEWFVKSENSDPKYKDYYVWQGGPTNTKPPNNWVSVFKDSAWTWSEKRKQFYLHQFAPEQPDLNFDNPAVVQEFKDILTFWLDRGVYGFRVDAVRHMFETGFKNEPPSYANVPNNDYGSLNHIYTVDQQKTYDMVYQWRKLVDDYTAEKGGDARILMTEVYSDEVNTMRYYGDGEQLGAHFSFNFFLITDLKSESTARDIVFSIRKWLTYMPFEYTANWVLGNHDNHRVATRMGKENVDGYNMLLALLPGVAVTYNGEEIGMENGEVTYEQGKDPSAIKLPESEFESVSRDFERTPFHWDSTDNAGFSNVSETWLPVSSKYLENNLAAQKVEGEWSHYRVYQALVKLRKESEVLATGRTEIEPYSDSTIVMKRTVADKSAYVLVFNSGTADETVNLKNVIDVYGSTLRIELSSTTSDRKIKDYVNTTNIVLKPHEALILVEEKSDGGTGGAIFNRPSNFVLFVTFIILVQ